MPAMGINQAKGEVESYFVWEVRWIREQSGFSISSAGPSTYYLQSLHNHMDFKRNIHWQKYFLCLKRGIEQSIRTNISLGSEN